MNNQSHSDPATAVQRRRHVILLLVLSAAFCAWFIALQARAPAHEGDSFEYAGVARALLRSGEMREDLLRTYSVPNQPLPHPAAQRAGLYPFLLVPFYAAFGDTNWTFVVPACIGLFFLPLLCYLAGLRFASPRDSFLAALLMLFSPALLRHYTFMDPGQPEVWQIILYLAFAVFLISDKFIPAGIALAAAYLFRNNSVVLIPAAAWWLARRRRLLSADGVKLFGAAALIVLPFLVRSWIVFGSPFYNEQFAGVSKVVDGPMLKEFENGNLLGIIFNYSEYNETSARPPVGRATHYANLARFIGSNIRIAVLGGQNSILYIPGIFQTIGLLLIPFLFIGARLSRGSPEIRLLLVIAVSQFVFHALFPIYSDRYLLCVLPFVFFIAVSGIGAFERWLYENKPQSARPSIAVGLVLFLLFSDFVGFFILNTPRLFAPEKNTVHRELTTVCNYLKKETSPGTVIMSYPALSTHFLCDRPTIPVPYGNLVDMAKAAKKYDAKYLIFANLWRGDVFPDLSFTRTLARGKFLTFYKIDDGQLFNVSRRTARRQESINQKLNPLRYFVSNRFKFEVAPPLYKTLSVLTRSPVTGFLIYLILAGLFIFMLQGSRLTLRILPIGVFLYALVLITGFGYARIYKQLDQREQTLSNIELQSAFEKYPESRNRPLIFIGKKKDIPLVLLSMFTVINDNDVDKNASCHELFIPIKIRTSLLMDSESLLKNMKEQQTSKSNYDIASQAVRDRGCMPVFVTGGVFGLPEIQFKD